MRKSTWIILGLLFAIGAAAFAGYRTVVAPQQAVRSAAPSSQSAGAPPSAARRLPSQPAPAAVGWQSFETVINVLNVVVGILGIIMTWHGMRMQRMALTSQSQIKR